MEGIILFNVQYSKCTFQSINTVFGQIKNIFHFLLDQLLEQKLKIQAMA
jgi:hypothetical protein